MSHDQRCRVIVVNYNAGEALLRCVGSVLANREPLQLVVADNDSSDGSCEILRSRFRSNLRLEVLENSSNLGFARAVNAVALRAEEPFLLILNPDCDLYPGCLAGLRRALEDDPSAALAAPRVVDRQENLLRGSLRRLPDPSRALLEGSGLGALGRWIPAAQGVEAAPAAVPVKTSRAEAVSGACMMIRTEIFRSLGGLDEGFAMHFEDLDFMKRCRDAGYHCLFVPEVAAFHQPGISSASRPVWVHWQKHSGMMRYFRKHCFDGYGWLRRSVVSLANWSHFALTLPFVLLRKGP